MTKDERMIAGDAVPRVCPACGASHAVSLLVGGLCLSCVARNVKSGLRGLLDGALAEKEPAALSIEGYEVQELIGGGGMGEVYRAVRIESREVVAIKIVAGRLTRDPGVTARFENEVSAMARLDHPNVVRVIDQGEAADGRHFLVTEFVDGCDLRRLMRAQRLEPARAFEIFAKVCAGVAHAHECGIVHRDIKPANILTGLDGTVKVADFGLAKTLADKSHWYGFTQTRDTFGTPYYIAPEVTRAAGAADKRADVYALGVLLYELLSGAVPMGQFTPLSQRMDIDRRMDGIIAEALADDPERRTASVTALAGAVAKIAAAHASRHRRSHLMMRATGALGVLVLGGAMGAWMMARRQPQNARPVFAEPAKATKEQPWENSLGMKFVPVPGRALLMSIWETRVRDYRVFSEAEIAGKADWQVGTTSLRKQMDAVKKGTAPPSEDMRDEFTTWDAPGFPQTPDDPACGIDLGDARMFCAWLTWRERNEGRLVITQRYRIPNYEEWSAAAAREESPLLPDDRTAQANFAGPEVRDIASWPADAVMFERRDPFPRTAPVGSFRPNSLGLYDMFGNIAEWVDTPKPGTVGDGSSIRYGVLGGSWTTGFARRGKTDYHVAARPGHAQVNIGFRIVLDLEVKSTPRALDPIGSEEK